MYHVCSENVSVGLFVILVTVYENNTSRFIKQPPWQLNRTANTALSKRRVDNQTAITD